MFTVYGLNGRIYSGALEGLRALEPVQAAARVRAVGRVQAGWGDPAEAELHGQVRRAVREQEGGDSDAAAGGRSGERRRSAPPSLSHASSAGPLVRQVLDAYTADSAPRHLLSQVQQLMSLEVLSLPLAMPLREAWQRMSAAGRAQAPVVDAAGRPVGLLLKGDLLPLNLGNEVELLDPALWQERLTHPVSSLMWSPIPSATAQTPLRELAQVLLELRLPGLPVVDADGRVEGFISRSDLLRAISRDPPLDLWG